MNNLFEVLQRASLLVPDQGIIHVNHEREDYFQTYKQLYRESKNIAFLLREKGINKGDILILSVSKSEDFTQLFWGCILAGIIPVPMPSIKYKGESSVLFNRLNIAADYLNVPLLISTDEMVASKLRERKRVLIDADVLLKHSRIQDFDFVPNEADKDSLAVIQFSSGSTGDPKGIMLSHRNILANMKLKKKFYNITNADTLIHWMPYYHDYGLFGNHINSIYNMITEIRIDPFSYLRNPLLWLKKITQYRATILASTTTGLEILLQKKGIDQPHDIDLSSVKVLSIGAEMIPSGLYDKVLTTLLPLGFSSRAYCPVYGLAEATLFVSGTNLDTGYQSIKIDRKAFVSGQILVTEHSDCEFVSVGKPMNDDIQVRIVKEGKEQEPLHLGSIQIKGDSVMQGYYNNTEATQDSLTAEGWLNTGDIGFFDSRMNLYITGRDKEIIIVNGQNYFPFDLESCIINQKESHIEKSIFASYYSNEEQREVLLHFFVLKKQSSIDDIETITKKLVEVVSIAAGISPDVSIPISKGSVPKTSSSKIMRNQLVKNYLNGKYKPIILTSKLKHKNMDIVEKYNYKNVLGSIWLKVLELDKEIIISLKNNFFALGGDSIRAMMGVAEIEEAYHVKLENGFFYKYPTLEKQIDYFQSVVKNIMTPEDEYEHILRELICDQLEITCESIGTTDNIMSKAKTVKDVLDLMTYLTEIFCLSDEEKDILLEKTTVKQIADIIRVKCRTNQGEPFPLMDFQETLYYHSHSKGFLRNEPTGLSCYIICRMSIKGNFQKEYFDRAFNFVIDSNPILHSVISEDTERPSMVILETYSKFESAYKDISHLSQQEQDIFFEVNDQEDHDHRFDLTLYPLFYSHIFKTNTEQHEVVVHIDHQLIDGFSFISFLRDIVTAYDQFADKKIIIPTVSEQLQFSDYVQLERLKSKTASYKKTMDFALKVFKDIPEKINLPLLKNPSLLQTVHFNTHHTQIDKAVMSSISDIVKSNTDLSMNALLLACYFRLVNVWSGQEDLIINIPLYNREQHFPAVKKVLGSFLDIFPIRIQAKSGESIISIARKIELFIRNMLEYPVSSIDLTRRILKQNGLKQGSLSPIIFSNSISMMTREEFKEISRYFKLEATKMQTGAPGTYIDLVMYNWGENWCFDWNYVRELFSKDSIETLSWQFTTMLKHLAEIKDDSSALAKYTGSNIMPEKYKALYAGVNTTVHEYPRTTIDQWINTVRKINPNKEAVCFEDVHLTYDQLYNQATQLAHLLKELGVRPNKRVALLMNRSHDLPIAQLAILIAGGAYVPIDPAYPVDRIQYMLEDCGAEVLISENTHSDLIESAYTEKIKYCILLGEQDNANLKKYSYKLYTSKDIVKYPFDEVPVSHSPEDLIYVIYTSGSTGQPKGTMLRHRNVCNFLYYVQTAFHLTARDRFALITSYSFDMTVTSNWLPFITGASLSILSEEKTKDVEQLLHFISNQKISFLNITPSHFSLLTNVLEFSEVQIPLEKQMTLMLGAEIINVTDVNKWLSYYPTHKLINEYGPTETTVASTFYPIPLNNQNQCELCIVPIGKPIYNTQIYILNENKEQCLPGVPGTLYIGGEGVSLGYLNQKEKTESVFIPNPLFQNANDIVYNTGDLAKFSETGDIIFIGRKDFQVNVRGYRIELREIEYALSKIQSIAEACADIQFDRNKHATIVLFYTTKTAIALDNDFILKSLERQLPQYMIPSVILHVDKIPITTNGKVDKKALPNISGHKQLYLSSKHVSPESTLEKQLAGFWSDTLDISPIGIHDNFWDIGGDSLSSVYLLTVLRDAGYKNIKLRHIFDYPTVAAMADYIDKDISTSEDNIVDLKSVTDAETNLFCLPYAAGTAAMYTKFVKKIADCINIQSVQYPGHGDTRQLVDSISEIGDLYVPYLRKKGADLYLLGYSYGGYIAYDICKKLEEEGIDVSGIILVGTTPPGIKDDLMALFSSEDHVLINKINDRDIMNQAFLDTLSLNEKKGYTNQLKNDTMAMLKYEFSSSKLKTPLLSIIGEEEEASIKNNQKIWEKYFETINYKTLKGGHLLIKEYHKELADMVTYAIKNESVIQL